MAIMADWLKSSTFTDITVYKQLNTVVMMNYSKRETYTSKSNDTINVKICKIGQNILIQLDDSKVLTFSEY